MEQTVKLSAFEEKAQQLEVIRKSIEANAVFIVALSRMALVCILVAYELI